MGWISIAGGLNALLRGVSPEFLIVGIISIAAGALIVAGLFTSQASIATVAGEIFRTAALPEIPAAIPMQSVVALSFAILLGAAVLLLGPGLYSLDFRFFGHREIVIPRRPAE